MSSLIMPATAPTELWKTSPLTKPAASSRSMFSDLPASCSWSQPLMRQQGSGKILNVSSIDGKGWEPIGAWYHATKFAVEGFSDCLGVELKPFGIDVIVIEPGAIRIEWGQIALDTLHQASGHTAYAPQAEEKRAMFLAVAGSACDPDIVAREIIKTIRSSRPKTRYAVGFFAKPSVLMSTFMPDRFNDWMIGMITKTLLKQQRGKAGVQVA